MSNGNLALRMIVSSYRMDLTHPQDFGPSVAAKVELVLVTSGKQIPTKEEIENFFMYQMRTQSEMLVQFMESKDGK